MNRITVTDEAVASMQDFYGIFFEDINHAADGGLYAELVRNRSFAFSPIDNPSYHALTAWKRIEEGGASVAASVSDKAPFSSSNPNYLVISIEKPGTRAGIKNLGYNSGIAIKKGVNYRFFCCARAQFPCTITISIDSASGSTYIAKELKISSAEWSEYELNMTVPADDFAAVLAITSREICKFCLNFVSLFPENTFKGRKNGMREDIAQMLADLKPRFMRFPGGCLVHDGTLNAQDRNSMYRWKNTLGPVTVRPSRRCNWGYNQSLGLGYFEYFQFCEDIGAKPLPVLPAGYNPHMEQAAALDEMQEWIDDALDLIEFANGDNQTHWGSLRCRMGHCEPFGLEYLAIGNEEVGQAFWDRYDVLHRAVREKYPQIKLINSAGPFPAGGEFERGWANARRNGSDLVDEHYYTSPEWMLANYHRYDSLPDGPKVFLGEYATWGNSFYNALVEAAYMTGLENNARHVGLACYAPLLCNADYVNWKPDLIWFDNHQVYGSVNYYAQKLFMNNTGTTLLRTVKTGLDKVVVLGGDKIAGAVFIETDQCSLSVSEITVTDISDGTVAALEAFSLRPAEKKYLADIDSEHYKIEFRAKKHFGEKGFRLLFGSKDDKTVIRWLVGGWANQDTEINALVDGRGTSLDHNMFSLASGCEYHFCMEVNGREIITYINGTAANKAVDRLPEIEELYFTASRDEGHIYVKCVNVREETVTAQLCIEGTDRLYGSVYTMTGEDKDENSFENPKKVIPLERELCYGNNCIEYTFPGKSITVFCVRRVWERDTDCDT